MRALGALLLGLLLTGAAAAGEDRPAAPVLAPDWSRIGPIFARQCTMCHGPQGAARGLRLDSFAAAVAGSDNGPVLLGGDPERSELIRRLRGLSTPRMPFLGYPLPEDQIDLIARWIAADLPGAD